MKTKQQAVTNNLSQVLLVVNVKIDIIRCLIKTHRNVIVKLTLKLTKKTYICHYNSLIKTLKINNKMMLFMSKLFFYN